MEADHWPGAAGWTAVAVANGLGRGHLTSRISGRIIRQRYTRCLCRQAYHRTGSMSTADRPPPARRYCSSGRLFGDRDFSPLPDVVEMFEILPEAQLAMLPGTAHVGVTRRPGELFALITRFLDA